VCQTAHKQQRIKSEELCYTHHYKTHSDVHANFPALVFRMAHPWNWCICSGHSKALSVYMGWVHFSFASLKFKSCLWIHIHAYYGMHNVPKLHDVSETHASRHLIKNSIFHTEKMKYITHSLSQLLHSSKFLSCLGMHYRVCPRWLYYRQHFSGL